MQYRDSFRSSSSLLRINRSYWLCCSILIVTTCHRIINFFCFCLFSIVWPQKKKKGKILFIYFSFYICRWQTRTDRYSPLQPILSFPLLFVRYIFGSDLGVFCFCFQKAMILFWKIKSVCVSVFILGLGVVVPVTLLHQIWQPWGRSSILVFLL